MNIYLVAVLFYAFQDKPSEVDVAKGKMLMAMDRQNVAEVSSFVFFLP